MNDHRLDKFLEEHYFSSLFEPNANNLCNYYDEDLYGNLKRDKPSHLNIFCMNIRSLPRHAGELIVFLKLLQTDFDIIVLTEIGARNISTVEHLLDDYEFLYTLPKSNMYGGVGLYLSKDITNVNILNNVCMNKTCHCSKCDYESMFISFKFQKNEFIIGGIYRHPNGNMKHFVDDLERTLMTINGKTSCIPAGDINIDIIKFENEGTMNYLTTLFSYRFLPYITLPSRITNFSATCIDHIFVRIADNKRIKPDDIASGLLFNDITDHLPCFISIKCGIHNTKMSRPLTRVFGDKNCQRFIESMHAENWQVLYEPDADWYSRFITVVKQKFETCFPLVRVSRKRIKDRPWITTGLKLSIKKSHRLYRNTLQDSCPHMISKYKKYKALLRNCLKAAEQSYFCELFDDTKQSAYNLWKNLGPVINPNKKKKQRVINKMCFDGKYVSVDQDIADHMNMYFCEIGEKLQDAIPDLGYDYKRYLPARVENTFFLSPTNIDEILNEIKKLNPRKSCGLDNIGAKVIKLCPAIFAENLSLINNKAIEIGKYPMALKVAWLLPCLKKAISTNLITIVP